MLSLVALALVIGAGVASAQGATVKGALGFHNSDAPIGIRWWLSDKLALDAGLGFGSTEFGGETFSNFAFDIGLPVMLKSWDRVNFMVRPGIFYASQEVPLSPGPGTGDDTALAIVGEFEAEVFLADNFSVSASHGLAIVNNDPAQGSSTSDWTTFGSNFTNVGFHVYLFGGSK
jgi:hypothetical protein